MNDFRFPEEYALYNSEQEKNIMFKLELEGKFGDRKDKVKDAEEKVLEMIQTYKLKDEQVKYREEKKNHQKDEKIEDKTKPELKEQSSTSSSSSLSSHPIRPYFALCAISYPTGVAGRTHCTRISAASASAATWPRRSAIRLSIALMRAGLRFVRISHSRASHSMR